MFRKKISLQLFPILILVAILPVGATHADVEHIVNGDFETGDLTGWSPVGQTFDGEVTSEEAHSGTYSLKMNAVDFIEQTFSPAIRPTDNLVFWAKTNGFAGAANALVQYGDGTTDSLLFGGSALPVGQWKQFGVAIDQTKLVVKVEFSTWETDPIYIDDISLQGLEEAFTTSFPIFTAITPKVTLTFLCNEVITNKGFETGDLTGWSPIEATFDGEVTSEEAHSGIYSLKMNAVDFISQTFNPAIRPTSNLVFWAKTEGFAGAANAKIEYTDETSDSLLFGGADLTPVGTWKQFTVPVDQTKVVYKVEFSTWETAPIYIDDVSLCGQPSITFTRVTTFLTPIIPSTKFTPMPINITLHATVVQCTNVIANGDFETGDLTAWTPFGPAFDGEVTNEYAHSGTYSLKLESVDFIEQSFGLAIHPTSDLVFWAKTESLAGVANVKIEYTDGTSDSLQFGGQKLSPVGEWHQITVSVDQTKVVRRVEFSTWETEPIYIDDISLCGELLIKPLTSVSETKIVIPPTTSFPASNLIVKTTSLTNETSPEPGTVTVTTTEEVGPPVPGFLSIPALFGLTVVALIFRRRRK